MFYQVANCPLENVCIVKNFEVANFSDFKGLVMTLKIDPQKYNWPQKTCKHFNNKCPGNRTKITIRFKSLNDSCFWPDVGP